MREKINAYSASRPKPPRGSLSIQGEPVKTSLEFWNRIIDPEAIEQHRVRQSRAIKHHSKKEAKEAKEAKDTSNQEANAPQEYVPEKESLSAPSVVGPEEQNVQNVESSVHTEPQPPQPTSPKSPVALLKAAIV